MLRGDHFPYTRNVVLLAMSTATLGRMSGGRPCLGLGPERKWDHPRQDGDALRRPLEGHGDCGRHPPGFADGRSGNDYRWIVPVDQRPAGYYAEQADATHCLAAIGPKALPLAGAIADGVLLNACTPVDHVKYAADGVRKAARETGRGPDSVDIACMLVMRQTDEPERFRPDLESRIGSLLGEPRVGGILLEEGRVRSVNPQAVAAAQAGRLSGGSASPRETTGRPCATSRELIQQFAVIPAQAGIQSHCTDPEGASD